MLAARCSAESYLKKDPPPLPSPSEDGEDKKANGEEEDGEEQKADGEEEDGEEEKTSVDDGREGTKLLHKSSPEHRRHSFLDILEEIKLIVAEIILPLVVSALGVALIVYIVLAGPGKRMERAKFMLRKLFPFLPKAFDAFKELAEAEAASAKTIHGGPEVVIAVPTSSPK